MCVFLDVSPRGIEREVTQLHYDLPPLLESSPHLPQTQIEKTVSLREKYESCNPAHSQDDLSHY